MIGDILYKVDSKGKIRTYCIELDGDRYRMITGLEDGKKTTSKWTECSPKNVGRSNETTSEEQARLEMYSRMTKKLEEHYYKTKDEAIANPDSFFKVMLATDLDKVKEKPSFPLLCDPKLDGMRLVANKRYKKSRRGKDVPSAYWIFEDLKQFLDSNPSITLDGEIYNHEYKEDFNTLMSIARREKMDEDQKTIAKEKLEYHVYDLFDTNNPDLTAIERKIILDNLPIYGKRVKKVNFDEINSLDELESIKGKHLEDGYEGSIIRTYDSKYENKRTKNLIKVKQFLTEEYKIIGINPGIGNRNDIAGSILVDVGGVTVGCGIRGSWEYSRNLLDEKSNLIGNKATIRHFGKTEDGSLRFPICVDINRPD